MLIRSGIILIKYWFSVSDEEQERRFHGRINDRTKHWKLSPMDLESRKHWFDYSRAKDAMFLHTDIPESPWWVVQSDDKKRARLNAIAHLLSMIPYHEVEQPPLKLPRRQKADETYVRPPIESQRWVPARAGDQGCATPAHAAVAPTGVVISPTGPSCWRTSSPSCSTSWRSDGDWIMRRASVINTSTSWRTAAARASVDTASPSTPSMRSSSSTTRG